jgi:hypothetical protein
MNFELKNKNCTIDSSDKCAGCTIYGELACKYDLKTLLSFLAIGFPPILIAIFGMVIVGVTSGQWWILVSYCAFTFGMLWAVEMFFLCRHCPFYAAEGSTIVCNANYGSLKLLPYDPRPMNGFERFMMRAFPTLSYFILPILGIGYGIYFMAVNFSTYGPAGILGLSGILFSVLASSVTFMVMLLRYYCSKCVNFSCPFNGVPKATVDAYLRKNDVMREAWEETGYVLD